MSKQAVSIKTVAEAVINILLKYGVKIQIYEAYSTNSIYLKFDFGLCNSLRISDHKGKPKLNYMFNLDTNHKGKPSVKKDKYTQYYYGFNNDHFKQLITHILTHRSNRIKTIGGWEKYQKKMKKQYKSNKNNKGFWSQSKIINERTISL